MSRASFASARWVTGIRDNKVYIEIWDGSTRILDANLDPEHASQLGHGLIENARRQGFKGGSE